MAAGIASVYTKEDYKGEFNLLAGERKVIVNALIKTRGSLVDAQKIVCPLDYPYTYNSLIKTLKRHSIPLAMFKKLKL